MSTMTLTLEDNGRQMTARFPNGDVIEKATLVPERGRVRCELRAGDGTTLHRRVPGSKNPVYHGAEFPDMSTAMRAVREVAHAWARAEGVKVGTAASRSTQAPKKSRKRRF